MQNFLTGGYSMQTNAADTTAKSEKSVFMYWDNSNIYISAQYAAEELEASSPDVRYSVRINLPNPAERFAQPRDSRALDLSKRVLV